MPNLMLISYLFVQNCSPNKGFRLIAHGLHFLIPILFSIFVKIIVLALFANFEAKKTMCFHKCVLELNFATTNGLG
jgi:hypothetical protein